MSTSQRAFDQVKNILGKLDRDIDAARARRLQDRPGAVSTTPATPAVVLPTTTIPASTPTPASNPAATQGPSRSGYGRATPMRPTRLNP